MTQKEEFNKKFEIDLLKITGAEYYDGDEIGDAIWSWIIQNFTPKEENQRFKPDKLEDNIFVKKLSRKSTSNYCQIDEPTKLKSNTAWASTDKLIEPKIFKKWKEFIDKDGNSIKVKVTPHKKSDIKLAKLCEEFLEKEFNHRPFQYPYGTPSQLSSDIGGATTKLSREGASLKHTAKVRPIPQLIGNPFTDIAVIYNKVNEIIDYLNKMKSINKKEVKDSLGLICNSIMELEKMLHQAMDKKESYKAERLMGEIKVMMGLIAPMLKINSK